MNKKVNLLLLLACIIGISSCVKDENDIFDKPASERLQNAIIEYKAILAGSANGWLADYYPQANHSVGGYAMFLKFDANGNVSVCCEINTNKPAKETASSEWDIIPETGPVLSFTTYNPVFHFFSEPIATDYNGLNGDYEFVVHKASQDTVELVGKKRANKLILRRNKDNLDPATYFDQVVVTADKVSEFGMFGIVINNKRIALASVVDRTFNVALIDTLQDETERVSYAFTPDGIRLYEPYTFNNITMQNFAWNASEEKYVCTDAGVNAFMDFYFPPDYQLRYGELIGTWSMKWHGASTSTWSTANVTVTPKKKNATYTLHSPAIFSFPGIELSFNAQKGIVSLLNQNAAKQESTGYDIRICAYDRVAGYLNTSSTGPVGLVGEWNKDADGIRSITFIDNKQWADYKPNGFLMRLYNGSTNMGNFTANIIDYRFNDITITKIN
jgi:hypothetical protein